MTTPHLPADLEARVAAGEIKVWWPMEKAPRLDGARILIDACGRIGEAVFQYDCWFWASGVPVWPEPDRWASLWDAVEAAPTLQELREAVAEAKEGG